MKIFYCLILISYLPDTFEQPENFKKQTDLIPISLDLEHNGYKIRETFLWNLHGFS
jgi:hypothetical protein